MKSSTNKIFRIAGAYIAWIIGSGFATGQEVLQFFSSYGFWSYGAVVVNLIGFLLLGYLLMKTGFDHKCEDGFNHFDFYCGKKIGTFYTWLITGILLLLIPVLLSGAGATMYEYYVVNKYIGSGLMAVMILVAYLIGFKRLIKIISSIGPIIVAFSLVVGIVTVAMDYDSFSDVPKYSRALAEYRTAPFWWLSGILYLGLNFFPGSTYFVKLGTSIQSEKELRLGAIAGAAALIASITIMSTAILLNGDATAGLDIPVLYLARKIAYMLGAAFSATLVLGIFSSSSIMMWTVCSRFTFGGKRGNVAFAVCVAAATYGISLCSFGELIHVLYPIVGYVGLFFLGCVIYKGLFQKKRPQQIDQNEPIDV